MCFTGLGFRVYTGRPVLGNELTDKFEPLGGRPGKLFSNKKVICCSHSVLSWYGFIFPDTNFFPLLNFLNWVPTL